MKKKKILKKLMTLMSVFAFICSNFLTPNIQASAVLSDDAEATVLNFLSSYTECAAEALTQQKDGRN